MVGIVNRRAPVIEHPMLVEGVVEGACLPSHGIPRCDVRFHAPGPAHWIWKDRRAVARWRMSCIVGVRSFSSHRPMVWWTNNDEWPRRCSPSLIADGGPDREGATLKRAEVWVESRLRFATPEVIRNDSVASRIDLSELDLLILDEAHHATGRHAMAQVGDLLRSDGRARPSVLGVTASPGSTLEGVQR